MSKLVYYMHDSKEDCSYKAQEHLNADEDDLHQHPLYETLYLGLHQNEIDLHFEVNDITGRATLVKVVASDSLGTRELK